VLFIDACTIYLVKHYQCVNDCTKLKPVHTTEYIRVCTNIHVQNVHTVQPANGYQFSYPLTYMAYQEILATCLDESWTYHFKFGLVKVFKFKIFFNDETQQNFQKCLLD
jgi:hypothetical protein